MRRTHAQRCHHLVACVACGGCPYFTGVVDGRLLVFCGKHAALYVSVEQRGTAPRPIEARR